MDNTTNDQRALSASDLFGIWENGKKLIPCERIAIHATVEGAILIRTNKGQEVWIHSSDFVPNDEMTSTPPKEVKP